MKGVAESRYDMERIFHSHSYLKLLLSITSTRVLGLTRSRTSAKGRVAVLWFESCSGDASADANRWGPVRSASSEHVLKKWLNQC